MKKQLIMRYFLPAESTDEGWEKYSLPVGNGYFGASVFGGEICERVQFTTNTFANNYMQGGVTNFGEYYIDFKCESIKNYERGLSLDKGVVYSEYQADCVNISREAFASYPDKTS